MPAERPPSVTVYFPNADDLEAIKEAAELSGLSPSLYLRSQGLRTARADLKKLRPVGRPTKKRTAKK